MVRYINKMVDFLTNRRLFSMVIVLFSMLMVMSGSIKKNAWQEDSIVQNDVIFYYSYLPAVWIYKDMSFTFLDNHEDESIKGIRIWTVENEHGNKFSKMTAGESILLSPFFLVAHQVAKAKGEVANGYSPTYYFSIVVAAWFYFFLALLLIRSVLYQLKIKELIVSVTLLTLTLGTNLIYYASIEVGMSHIYSFFLFALALWVTVKWHNSPKWWNSILLGGTLGLIVLTRIPNAIFLIVPAVYGVYSMDSLISKIQFIKSNLWKFIVVGLSFVLTAMIQPLLWKWGTGEWFVYSYSDEGFFFLNPQVFGTLFSFRKGLFIYVPILIVGFIGIILLRKQSKSFFLPVLLFSLINIYVLSSWWCWWFGGGLGNRAFIESYALLAIPLAFGLEWIRKKLTVVTLFTIIGLAISFNFFLLNKYLDGVLHFDAMTKDAFVAMFNKGYQHESYWDKMLHPSYANRVIGKDENEPLSKVLFDVKDTTLSQQEFPITPYEELGSDYFTKYQTKINLKGSLKLPESLDSSQFVAVVLDIRDPRFTKSFQYETISFNADSLASGQEKHFDVTFDTPRVWGNNIVVKMFVWNKTRQPIYSLSFKATQLIY